MPDARDLAVHNPLRPHHLAAEGLADRLVSETHAEDRDAAGEALDRCEGDAGLVRRARTGRDHDVRGRERTDFLDGELVVAKHAHLGAKLAQVLNEVEGKRIVVVDHQYHDARYAVDSTDGVRRWARRGRRVSRRSASASARRGAG